MEVQSHGYGMINGDGLVSMRKERKGSLSGF